MKPIIGKNIVLRLVEEKDIPQIYRWYNNPEVKPFWYGKDRTRELSWVEDKFKKRIKGLDSTHSLIIEVNERAIGYLNITQSKNDDNKPTKIVELDILIGEVSYWGKGYGQDALQTIINYLFEQEEVERIYLQPRISNSRAIHLYQKVGFQQEGILRHAEYFEGKWIDLVMMSIIKSDYKNK